MAATVLGKFIPLAAFINTGTLVSGSLTIADARLLANSFCVAFYIGALSNGGQLTCTVTNGQVIVASSNVSDASNIGVLVLQQ